MLGACGIDDEIADDDLGDIGDGKSDSFGVVDREFTIGAGRTRRFTFTANAAFRVAVTQPEMAVADRVLILREGRVERELDRRQIHTEEQLHHAVQGVS